MDTFMSVSNRGARVTITEWSEKNKYYDNVEPYVVIEIGEKPIGWNDATIKIALTKEQLEDVVHTASVFLTELEDKEREKHVEVTTLIQKR